MAVDPTTTAGIGGITFLFLNILGYWYREWRKHRTWRTNGKDLGEIKAKVEGIDEKVGETKIKVAEIQVAVDAQKQQCGTTVERFDNAISKQQEELLKIARGK